MKEKIFDFIYKYFISSSDFNGVSLREISGKFDISYIESIEIVKDLVFEKKVSIQSSTNPYIIGYGHFPIENQIQVLDEAKNYKSEKLFEFGDVVFTTENCEYPVCLYPHPEYLQNNRDLSSFSDKPYSKELALGEPQLKPHFFEIDVLTRYFDDPRYYFNFDEFGGTIYPKSDRENKQILKEKDEAFLQTFGIGVDENFDRIAVVYNRYLNDLSAEHQLFWKSKEIFTKCKILKEYYETSILGEFTNSISVYTAFIDELNFVYDLTNRIYGKNLFIRKFESENKPKELTYFFIPTLKNYENFIHLLDKLLSDNINKKFFDDKLEPYEMKEIEPGIYERKLKGTLTMLEEWLLNQFNENQNEIKELIKYAKNIRKERQSPAHEITFNEYDKKYNAKQKNVIQSAYNFVHGLRVIFMNNPLSCDVEVPYHLDTCLIKNV